MTVWPSWLTPTLACEIIAGIFSVLSLVLALAFTTIIVVKASIVLEDSSSILPMLAFKSQKVIELMQNAGILLRFVDFIDRIVASHNFLLPPILHLGFRVPPRVRSERVEGHGFGRAEDELQFTLSALIREANSLPCSATGRLVWGQMIYHCALVRGRVYSYLERHQSILKVPVRRPVFILGLPRTGSTLLQRLLALDTNNRAFQLWELMQPVPPPRPESYDSDWRKGCLRQSQWWLDLFSNGWVRHLGEFHESKSDMFEEELVLMLGCGVAGPNHVSLGGVRTLYERRHLADHLSPKDENKAAMYRYIRRVAQALTVHMGAPSLDGAAASSESKQLIFKSPLHSLWVGALLREFPDAQLLLLHRSPVAVVTSWLAFALANASILSSERASNKSIWARRVVDTHVRLLSVMSERIVQLQSNHADRVFECGFSDFVADPRAMVQRIYRHLNLTLSPAFDARMKEYLKQDRKRHIKKDRNRKVRLQLKDLGLTWTHMWDSFGTYYRTNQRMCSDVPFQQVT